MAGRVHTANSVSVMWLDHDVSDDPTRAIESLRRQIGRFERFTDLATCEVAVQQHREPIILVVSGQMGRELIPRIHQLPQLVTVFVYCLDKQRNKEWSKRYFKVSFVTSIMVPEVSLTLIGPCHKSF